MARAGRSENTVHRAFVSAGQKVRGGPQRQVKGPTVRLGVFYALIEAPVRPKWSGQTYNRVKLFRSLGYQVLTPATIHAENIVSAMFKVTQRLRQVTVVMERQTLAPATGASVPSSPPQ